MVAFAAGVQHAGRHRALELVLGGSEPARWNTGSSQASSEQRRAIVFRAPCFSNVS